MVLGPRGRIPGRAGHGPPGTRNRRGTRSARRVLYRAARTVRFGVARRGTSDAARAAARVSGRLWSPLVVLDDRTPLRSRVRRVDPMSIAVVCPACAAAFKVRDDLAGRKVK